MNAKKFSDAISELDTKYVDEALNYKKKAKKPGWVKWGAMAACFAVIAVLGVGVLLKVDCSGTKLTLPLWTTEMKSSL